MKIAIFLNSFGLGGTGQAAIRWAWGLKERGHIVAGFGLEAGPHGDTLENHGVPIQIVPVQADAIADALRVFGPEVIHVHALGQPNTGDVLGAALRLLPQRIPVVQTNVFGRLENPAEDAWTDFRLFVSWTSCVQAARRYFRKLDARFFRRASVAVYPLDPIEPPPVADIAAFRKRLGVADDEILFGRFSRPEPNKWTPIALDAFRRAVQHNPKIKLLLREPPPLVAAQLRASPDASRFVILPITADPSELRLTMAALDAVLHTSSMGESFGYGIAEPMNLGKPVITHSLPWKDQAQVELVRHGEAGFVASTPATMAKAILQLAGDVGLRTRLGRQAREHIRTLADPETSIRRLEAILQAVITNRDNPFEMDDLTQAKCAADYLDDHQFGHSLLEQLALRPFYYRVRLHQYRNKRR